jgi:hypothetical protein
MIIVKKLPMLRQFAYLKSLHDSRFPCSPFMHGHLNLLVAATYMHAQHWIAATCMLAQLFYDL